MKVEHTFRVGHRETKTEMLGRAEAIKWFCFECMGFSRVDIKDCTAPTCPLYVFRGAPPRKLDLSEERRAELREGFLANLRAKDEENASGIDAED